MGSLVNTVNTLHRATSLSLYNHGLRAHNRTERNTTSGVTETRLDNGQR